MGQSNVRPLTSLFILQTFKIKLFLNSYFLRQSIILPVYNAEPWLTECLQSVLDQDTAASLELSVFMDACTVSLPPQKCLAAI